MKNRNSSPAKSILESATQTAASQIESESPQRATDLLPVSEPFGTPDAPLPSTLSLSHSVTSPLSPDFSSSAPSAPLPLDPSAPSSSPLSEALAYIAANPASEILAQFQSHFSEQFFNPENERDLKRLDLFLSIYAKLQNSAAFERVSIALDQVGQSPKREKLLKELIKVMSIQDRSIARAFREQESIAKEKRRIEREAKREQSQAAKQAREDRAFNQREDHLTRKEKLAKDQFDVELLKRANLIREQVNKHIKPQTASQTATDVLSPSSHSEISIFKSGIAVSDSPQAAIEQHAA